MLFLVITVLFGLAGAALADPTYNTYAGQRGLVTIAQLDQAAKERKAAEAFRNMSIYDRWDSNDKGSLASRWSDTGPGSIARRWEEKR